MTNIVFIPARGGSKSIPLKNIMEINGKPLIYWIAKVASESKYIDRIIIATENEKIKNTVLNFNFSRLEVYDRNPINARDESPTMDLINEFLNAIILNDNDNLFLLQATSPLLKTIHLNDLYESYLLNKYDSMLTCVKCKRFFWTKNGKPINYDYMKRPRRQDFEGCMMENGACYLTTIKNIKNNQNLLGGKIGIYEMPEYTATELDEPNDSLIIEKLLKKYKNE